MLRTGAGVLFALLAIATQPSAWGQTYTTFDPPGSQGTSPVSINAAGQITGSFFDVNFATHGFLRDTDGTITTFDVPGASNPPGTSPGFITSQGLIVGTYYDSNFGQHIFLRAKDGTITTLQFPGGTSYGGEFVANSAGAIAGLSFDANGNLQGFLRAPSGKFTFFEFPPAFIPPPMPFSFAPNVTALSPGGTILGSYFDENLALHGFLRTIDGTFTTFDIPNALAEFPFQGTIPASINDSGTVTGFYFDTTKNSDLRVFIRATNGSFTTFDTPQLGSFGGSAPINSSGVVAGNVQNCSNFPCTPISFLRANGKVSPVNDPEAVQGTAVTGITPAGEMIGNYVDGNGGQHGFVVKH